MEAIELNGNVYVIEEFKNGNMRLQKLKIEKVETMKYLKYCTNDELLNEFMERPFRDKEVINYE